MSDSVEVTLVANAGVLVRYQGSGILVDGIHHEDGHPFSRISPMDLHLMKMGSQPFAQLDYLLFTHEHPDHFTPLRVLDHLRNRPAKGVFVPDRKNGSAALGQLLDEVREQGIEFRTLGLEPGRVQSYALEDGLELTVIGTRHMGPQYQSVRNDCFILSLGGVNLMFTGDADYVADYYEKSLPDLELDAVFVNPLFYHNPHGQSIINDIFRPRNVVIYHMPPVHNDPMQLGLTVERALKKYSRPEVPTHVLRVEKQLLSFKLPC